MDREDKILKKFLLFILLSLLLHLGLVLFFYKVPFQGNELPSPQKPQEVVFVNPQNLVTAPSPRQLELADIAKPKEEKVPAKARFASRYNSTVKEETVAKKIPKKARPDVEVSEEAKRSNAKKPVPKKELTAQNEEEKFLNPTFKETTKSGKKGEEKSDLSLADLKLKPSDFKDLIGDQGKGDKNKAEASEKNSREIAMLPRSPVVSGPGDRFVHDFFPDVKIGDKTYLNAMAFPDVQYFTQLKRIFRIRFDPRAPLISYFRVNRVVVGSVNVTMAMEVSASGKLTKLFVVESSGIPGYDREALQTIRESAPFAAPPKKILSQDGMLRMTWHFTTYL